jgi:DNA replication protein DnaC
MIDTKSQVECLCATCNQTFYDEAMSIGGRVIKPNQCEACEIGEKGKATAKNARPVIELGEDWPERQKGAIANRKGQALEVAGMFWSKMVCKGQATIILFGDRGRGKTWIACYWAYLRGQAGDDTGMYRTAYDFFLEIRQAWRQTSKVSEREAMLPYRNTPFLVLDQLHQCRALDASGGDKAAMWERMALADLLDYRYREQLLTVLIVTLPTIEEVAEVIDADIWERVKESGGLVACNWESYR